MIEAFFSPSVDVRPVLLSESHDNASVPSQPKSSAGSEKGSSTRMRRRLGAALSAFLGLSHSVRAKPAHKLIMTTTQGDVAIKHHDTALVPLRVDCLRSKYLRIYSYMKFPLIA
jgi:hypothetical protein